MIETDVKNATDVARAVKLGLLDGPATVRRSQAFGNLARALLRCQVDMKNPPKTADNPHFRSRFADLATVRETVLPVFTKHGVVVLQAPCEMAGEPALTTLLVHAESGEWFETVWRTRPVKSDPQAAGSALTYARRYVLQTLAGVTGEDDDDGNAGSAPGRDQERAAPAESLQQSPDWFASEIQRLTGRPAFDALWEKFTKTRGRWTPADVERVFGLFGTAAKKFPRQEPAKK